MESIIQNIYYISCTFGVAILTLWLCLSYKLCKKQIDVSIAQNRLATEQAQIIAQQVEITERQNRSILFDKRYDLWQQTAEICLILDAILEVDNKNIAISTIYEQLVHTRNPIILEKNKVQFQLLLKTYRINLTALFPLSSTQVTEIISAVTDVRTWVLCDYPEFKEYEVNSRYIQDPEMTMRAQLEYRFNNLQDLTSAYKALKKYNDTLFKQLKL
ncbi:MAG: hypothetical protein R3Y12_00800 [Clostridia bacterium]